MTALSIVIKLAFAYHDDTVFSPGHDPVVSRRLLEDGLTLR
jgi:hypothetical protein